MANLPSTSDLPYYLPTTTAEQLRYLARVLSIPERLIANGGEHELEAMSATILYRHMDARQRYAAMTSIRSLPNRELEGLLVRKALNTTFVNPQWGVWSLTTEELERDIAFHSALETVAAVLGVSFSVTSGKDIVNEIYKTRRLSKGGTAMIVIWTILAFNHSSLRTSVAERDRRTQIKTSTYYQ